MSELYFIAILTPEELTHSIRNIQKDFAENYNSQRQLKIPVHITLVQPFRATEDEVEELYKALKDKLNMEPFSVMLEGFGAFDQRVIFVDVKTNEKLNILQSKVKSCYLTCTGITNPYPKKYKPHITVANRDLTKDQFRRAWQKYKDAPFKVPFLLDEICLLKHTGQYWEVLKTLHIENTSN